MVLIPYVARGARYIIASPRGEALSVCRAVMVLPVFDWYINSIIRPITIVNYNNGLDGWEEAGRLTLPTSYFSSFLFLCLCTVSTVVDVE